MRAIVFIDGAEIIRVAWSDHQPPEAFGTEPHVILDIPEIDLCHLSVVDGAVVITPVEPDDPMNMAGRASYRKAVAAKSQMESR